MKINKTVMGMLEKALKKAEHAEDARGEISVKRDGKEVYRLVVTQFETRLYHYGTLILNLGNYRSTPILEWGGYSASDRDAMNTLLSLVGSPYRFCIRQFTLQFAN